MSSEHLKHRLDMRGRVETDTLLVKIRQDLGPNFGTVAFAEWLGRHRNQPLGWIRSGQLRAAKIGRTYIISAEDAATFLAKAYVETHASTLWL